MATRFMYITLATTALGVALSFLVAAPTTASPAWSYMAAALPLDPPAAPSNCKTKTIHLPSFFSDHGMVSLDYLSWSDNSSNEAGFTVEEWSRDQSGAWVLRWSQSTAANSTTLGYLDGKWPNYKFRVKAFNASGDSPWSNWSH